MRANKRRTTTASVPERPQREVLRDVMLSAWQCDTWLTLRELAAMTHYGEASISAQLRHLRKARFGAFVVEKRLRKNAQAGRRHSGPVWEYQMSFAVRREVKRWRRGVLAGRVLRSAAR